MSKMRAKIRIVLHIHNIANTSHYAYPLKMVYFPHQITVLGLMLQHHHLSYVHFLLILLLLLHLLLLLLGLE